ncbi:Cell division cycle protein 27-like B, partial [Mucuna pruriens]
MEAILADCVQKSLRHFMHANAIFLCQRLCVEFPTEVPFSLFNFLQFFLSSFWFLTNPQKMKIEMEDSLLRYKLRELHRWKLRDRSANGSIPMDLLSEAEAALCPANEPSVEVPNGAAGHYLLGMIYRYTDRRKSAIHHFKQALSMDPLMWAAYEELC